MSEKTAVTENISYETRNCQFCNQDVAIDEVPENTFEETGYVVLIGEGSVSHNSENEGNWDEEFAFELDESAGRHPNVEGHIICEDCAKKLHDFDQDGGKFTGHIPNQLQPTDSSTIEDQVKVILSVAIVCVILFLIILLML